MAQHPFAAKARAIMAENGIIVNPDGTTSLATSTVEQNAVSQPTYQQEPTPLAAPETDLNKDQILELQRQELETLRSMKSQWQANQNQATPQGPTARELELEQQLAELRSKLEAQPQAEDTDAIRAVLEAQGFDSEYIDDEALLEIRNTFFSPIASEVDKLKKELETYRDKFRDPTPEEKQEQIKKQTNKKLVEAIPDFQTIFDSSAFQKRLAEKDSRFPTKTYGEAMQIAYDNGNHEFIVQEVKNFLNGGTAPNIGDIADVGASNGVGTKSQAQASDGYTFTNEEAIEMLRKNQRGLISRKEYSEYRAKLDAHRSRT